MAEDSLIQLTAPLTITDGGIETTLIFHEGIDLPHFASFVLLDSRDGRDALNRYVDSYIAVAIEHDIPLIIETPTWRASSDWAQLLGISGDDLADLNRRSVSSIAARVGGAEVIISGCVGPRGDGYVADMAMTAAESADYHRRQVGWLKEGGADLVCALTMTSVAEATGIALAARDADIASVVSFTVETDGRLPSGELLSDAVIAVDSATDSAPIYYMINCAHPTHFDATLEEAPWMSRIKGIRANASTMSHEELDNAEELDAGDPADLADRYKQLRERFPSLTIFGGCCGTDSDHIAAMVDALKV